MSMDSIRKSYGVPAKRGMRVVYRGDAAVGEQTGTIVGAMGQTLRVRLDDQAKATARTFHPTWAMQYPPGKGEANGCVR